MQTIFCTSRIAIEKNYFNKSLSTETLFENGKWQIANGAKIWKFSICYRKVCKNQQSMNQRNNGS